MKKILLISLLALCGCSTMDEKLMNNFTQYKIVETINAYYESADNSLNCTMLKDNSISRFPKKNYSNTSSKICFFNYDRYLPKNTDIKTEEDFLRLISKNKGKICSEKTNREYCLQKEEKKLSAYINGGIAQEKIEEEKLKEQRRLEEEKRKRLEQEELARREAEERKRKEKIERWKTLKIKECSSNLEKLFNSDDFMKNGIISYCEQSNQSSDLVDLCKDRISLYVRHINNKRSCLSDVFVMMQLSPFINSLDADDDVSVARLLDVASQFRCSISLMSCQLSFNENNFSEKELYELEKKEKHSAPVKKSKPKTENIIVELN